MTLRYSSELLSEVPSGKIGWFASAWASRARCWSISGGVVSDEEFRRKKGGSSIAELVFFFSASGNIPIEKFPYRQQRRQCLFSHCCLTSRTTFPDCCSPQNCPS